MPSKNSNSYNTPKDFFIYLLSVISLYIFYSSLIILLFKFVNLLFPSFRDAYDMVYYIESIRWYIALLIITFPMYLFTFIAIRKDYIRYPEKRNLKVRKWLLYFTLFMTALIVMCDVGALLYYFLGGDITVRFVLKTLILFIFASLLFLFYLRELHRGWHANQIRAWLLTLIIVTLLTLAYGFYLIGSPSIARRESLDKIRTSDLTSIQNEIINYFRQKKQLPESLDILNNKLSGFKVPLDPVTKTAYRYDLLSKFTFVLCTTFAQPSQNNFVITPLNRQNWNWMHPKGYYCFERTIDPQLYSAK